MGYDEPRLVWTSLNICGIEYYHTTHRVPIHNSQSTKTPPRAHGLPPWKVPNKALSLSLLCTPTHTPNTQFLSHVDTLNPYFFFGSAVGLKEEVVLGQP